MINSTKGMETMFELMIAIGVLLLVLGLIYTFSKSAIGINVFGGVLG